MVREPCSFFVVLVLVIGCTEDPVRPPVADSSVDTSVAADTSTPDTSGGPRDAATDTTPACTPECVGLECGDDGCGGDCGPCASDDTCNAGVCVTPMIGACPPTGPYGGGVGEVTPDVILYDCEDNPVNLHDLCDYQVSWIFEFAAWCPPCQAFARADVNRIYESFAAEDFEAYFIISEDVDFGAPTAEFCRSVRDNPLYGLTMPVLYDPTGALQTALGIRANEENIVMTRGNVIHWGDQYENDMVEGRITEALALP